MIPKPHCVRGEAAVSVALVDAIRVRTLLKRLLVNSANVTTSIAPSEIERSAMVTFHIVAAAKYFLIVLLSH